MNHSFEQIIFSELDESVHQIGLNRLNQFTVQAAQIYKLLNQNSLSDPWQSIWLEMSQNSSISDPVMNELIQCFSPPAVTELRKQFDSDRRPFLMVFVTLEHKSSLKQHRYICSNNQQYTVWVKIINFSLMPKIIKIFNKDHVPWIYFVNLL